LEDKVEEISQKVEEGGGSLIFDHCVPEIEQRHELRGKIRKKISQNSMTVVKFHGLHRSILDSHISGIY
jgi:hypothetical protein